MKNILTVLMSVVLLSTFAVAQTTNELGSPGITPDSPFYFLDRISDAFQSADSLANEKAAEVYAMAQKGDENALNKSLGLHENALNRLRERANISEEFAERVANQTTKHLGVLAGVLEQVPEQAKAGLQKAIENSARGREEAVNALRKMNPEKGEMIAIRTLERLRANASEEALNGLNNALEKAGSKDRIPSQGQAGQQQTGNGTSSGQESPTDNAPEDETSANQGQQGAGSI